MNKLSDYQTPKIVEEFFNEINKVSKRAIKGNKKRTAPVKNRRINRQKVYGKVVK